MCVTCQNPRCPCSDEHLLKSVHLVQVNPNVECRTVSQGAALKSPLARTNRAAMGMPLVRCVSWRVTVKRPALWSRRRSRTRRRDRRQCSRKTRMAGTQCSETLSPARHSLKARRGRRARGRRRRAGVLALESPCLSESLLFQPHRSDPCYHLYVFMCAALTLPLSCKQQACAVVSCCLSGKRDCRGLRAFCWRSEQ